MKIILQDAADRFNESHLPIDMSSVEKYFTFLNIKKNTTHKTNKEISRNRKSSI